MLGMWLEDPEDHLPLEGSFSCTKEGRELLTMTDDLI